VWKLYDRDLSRYSEETAGAFLKNNFQDPVLINHWLDIFNRLKKGEIDTWDQQFQLMTFFENGLCITPNVNLISNIGFGAGATHTHNPHDQNANKSLGEIKHVVHPHDMIADKEADYFLFNHEFKLDEKRLKIEKDKLTRRRFKKWLRGLLKKSSS
jgi:hypothetical protein